MTAQDPPSPSPDGPPGPGAVSDSEAGPTPRATTPAHGHEHHLHAPDLEEINKAAGRDLPAALLVGFGLAGAVLLCLLYWNWGFVLIVGTLFCLGTIELHQALQRQGMTSSIVPIAIGTVGIIVGSYVAGSRPGRISSDVVLLGSLAVTVIAALIWRMPRGAKGFVRDSAASLFIIAYVPLLGSFVTLMLAAPDGPARLISTILCIAGSDTGGYAAGVLFGRHQMAPTISPKKTWEGFAGSILLASGVGAASAIWILHAPWWVGLVLGLAMVGFATAGDLIESLIKRDVGIKDMSSFLPGHGGVMDRLDSMLIGSPVAWLLLLLLVPPR